MPCGARRGWEPCTPPGARSSSPGRRLSSRLASRKIRAMWPPTRRGRGVPSPAASVWRRPRPGPARAELDRRSQTPPDRATVPGVRSLQPSPAPAVAHVRPRRCARRPCAVALPPHAAVRARQPGLRRRPARAGADRLHQPCARVPSVPDRPRRPRRARAPGVHGPLDRPRRLREGVRVRPAPAASRGGAPTHPRGVRVNAEGALP